MTDPAILAHIENLVTVVEKLNDLDTQRGEEIQALSNRIEALTQALAELRGDVASALVEGTTLA